MTQTTLILSFSLILLSCRNIDTNTKTQSKASENDIVTEGILIDSVKTVGNNILKGESIWGKNEKYIFPLMDSLNSSNPQSRLFYFKVFAKICDQSDGYVGEAIGLYVLKYFEFAPSEFIVNSKVISDTTFKSMAYNAGIEISMTNEGDPNEVYGKLKGRTYEKVKGLNELEMNKLDIFLNQMKEGINSNME